MKRFASIEKIDTAILYALELTASISVLLLAFGLIASMANVLTEGSVLTDNLLMQRVWAWTQCVAIDASVAGTIMRTFRSYARRERVKYILYGLLSVLLLFTAAIVSNIESVQQTLNITLEAAYVHVFIPVEALIWIRSLVIVLLIVAHALRHVQREPDHATATADPTSQPTPRVMTPELVDALCTALSHATVSAEPAAPQALPPPQGERQASNGEQRANAAQEATATSDHEQVADEREQEANNYQRVKTYLATHPQATDRAIADALAISASTANKWRKRIERASAESEHREQYM